MTIFDLGSVNDAFASGGNRLCFIDPTDSQRCIKILREDRSPAIKRAKKKFPFNLRKQHYFDDNWQEWLVYQRINRCVGESAYELIPRCFGLVETNLGRGLMTEMVKDDDGLISISLKQYLWTIGLNDQLSAVLEQFLEKWAAYGMPSRNLLLHNIVVKMQNERPEKLLVIDGLGWPDVLPLGYWFPSIAKRKAARKAARLMPAIKETIDVKIPDNNWGYHGWIDIEDRKIK